jgi:hypothetical protein
LLSKEKLLSLQTQEEYAVFAMDGVQGMIVSLFFIPF